MYVDPVTEKSDAVSHSPLLVASVAADNVSRQLRQIIDVHKMSYSCHQSMIKKSISVDIIHLQRITLKRMSRIHS